MMVAAGIATTERAIHRFVAPGPSVAADPHPSLTRTLPGIPVVQRHGYAVVTTVRGHRRAVPAWRLDAEAQGWDAAMEPGA